jgi:HPt (histidine-containing phosphotransfer) domain-containing protein
MGSTINSEEIFLDELKKEFIEKLKQDIDVINESLDAGNPAAIAKIAHDIKGTIGIFGYDEGTDLSLKLQLAAEDGQPVQILSTYHDLLSYLRVQKLI